MAVTSRIKRKCPGERLVPFNVVSIDHIGDQRFGVRIQLRSGNRFPAEKTVIHLESLRLTVLRIADSKSTKDTPSYLVTFLVFGSVVMNVERCI